jgi:hypothetical protein
MEFESWIASIPPIPQKNTILPKYTCQEFQTELGRHLNQEIVLLRLSVHDAELHFEGTAKFGDRRLDFEGRIIKRCKVQLQYL